MQENFFTFIWVMFMFILNFRFSCTGVCINCVYKFDKFSSDFMCELFTLSLIKSAEFSLPQNVFFIESFMLGLGFCNSLLPYLLQSAYFFYSDCHFPSSPVPYVACMTDYRKAVCLPERIGFCLNVVIVLFCVYGGRRSLMFFLVNASIFIS